MKKTLKFIPLAIGIGAAFLYIYGILSFKFTTNTMIMSQILYNLRVYLYISVAAFIVYFLIRLIDVLTIRKTIIEKREEPVKIMKRPKKKIYVDDSVIYCTKCGEEIDENDTYCRYCGRLLSNKKPKRNIIKTILKIMEIVILIFIIYMLVILMLDYKEKKDPNFKNPFRIVETK